MISKVLDKLYILDGKTESYPCDVVIGDIGHRTGPGVEYSLSKQSLKQAKSIKCSLQQEIKMLYLYSSLNYKSNYLIFLISSDCIEL